MALERTLSIIKPDAVKKNAIGQILARHCSPSFEKFRHFSKGLAWIRNFAPKYPPASRK